MTCLNSLSELGRTFTSDLITVSWYCIKWPDCIKLCTNLRDFASICFCLISISNISLAGGPITGALSNIRAQRVIS